MSVGIGIVELGDICAAMRARSLDLFEITGAWVFDTADGEEQRWYAVGSHRHAWHAELWAERCPAIPPVDLDALVAARRAEPDQVDADDRPPRYRGWLDDLLTALDDVEARTTPELDPATVRAITLTRADLVELRSR